MIFNYSPSGGRTTITNSTITGNTATGVRSAATTYPTAGGGLALLNVYARAATISNTEISGNTAPLPGVRRRGGGLATIGRITDQRLADHGQQVGGPGRRRHRLPRQVRARAEHDQHDRLGQHLGLGLRAASTRSARRPSPARRSAATPAASAASSRTPVPCYGSLWSGHLELDRSTATTRRRSPERRDPTGYGGGVYLGGPYQVDDLELDDHREHGDQRRVAASSPTATTAAAATTSPRARSRARSSPATRRVGRRTTSPRSTSAPAFGFTAGNSLIQNKGSAPVISDPAVRTSSTRRPGWERSRTTAARR